VQTTLKLAETLPLTSNPRRSRASFLYRQRGLLLRNTCRERRLLAVQRNDCRCGKWFFPNEPQRGYNVVEVVVVCARTVYIDAILWGAQAWSGGIEEEVWNDGAHLLTHLNGEFAKIALAAEIIEVLYGTSHGDGGVGETTFVGIRMAGTCFGGGPISINKLISSIAETLCPAESVPGIAKLKIGMP
jgi:hypothetical protein